MKRFVSLSTALVVWLAVAMTSTAPSHAGPPHYRVVELGPAEDRPFTPHTAATSISNTGLVSGYAFSTGGGIRDGYLWKVSNSSAIVAHDFGWYANDVNNSGQVVGEYNFSGFLWENGNFVDLGLFPDGLTTGAYAINNAGQIVGAGRIADGDWRATLWENGQINDLGTLGEGSYANDINDAGQIVGSYDVDSLNSTFR